MFVSVNDRRSDRSGMSRSVLLPVNCFPELRRLVVDGISLLDVSEEYACLAV